MKQETKAQWGFYGIVILVLIGLYVADRKNWRFLPFGNQTQDDLDPPNSVRATTNLTVSDITNGLTHLMQHQTVKDDHYTYISADESYSLEIFTQDSLVYGCFILVKLIGNSEPTVREFISRFISNTIHLPQKEARTIAGILIKKREKL